MAIKSATPYLTLGGKGDEAIALYKSALGANVVTLQRFGEVQPNCPEAMKNWVMHAALQLDFIPLWDPAAWQAWVTFVLAPLGIFLVLAGLFSENALSISIYQGNERPGAVVARADLLDEAVDLELAAPGDAGVEDDDVVELEVGVVGDTDPEGQWCGVLGADDVAGRDPQTLLGHAGQSRSLAAEPVHVGRVGLCERPGEPREPRRRTGGHAHSVRSLPRVRSRSSWNSNQMLCTESRTGEETRSWSPASTAASAAAKRSP